MLHDDGNIVFVIVCSIGADKYVLCSVCPTCVSWHRAVINGGGRASLSVINHARVATLYLHLIILKLFHEVTMPCCFLSAQWPSFFYIHFRISLDLPGVVITSCNDYGGSVWV
ncbi:unnamed protein product [Spodoptera littoralis]|uniref:Uncharacterized protein n=1 Tax=Spodoptera littoralis TaxID=7109 RepID=A0A9P0II72_SPOLI|nr:unnamed protein product [Spodoptera littoralis]CAH1647315.1 unnamed protein product [Spodoptera littoralis]